MKPPKPKRGPGRPPGNGKGRSRPVLKTSVAPATLAYVRAAKRAWGRTLDDAVIYLQAVETCAKRRRMSVAQVIEGLES